ncbi:hypothetical protein [Cohnella massiliensis]|uniref:hypothetical protein n=1 Tax=Cohnella massiliensis TaxID=1816691 RepID=UPI00111AC56C|nr:hypothetical protein [Cohnella massiliensis]
MVERGIPFGTSVNFSGFCPMKSRPAHENEELQWILSNEKKPFRPEWDPNADFRWIFSSIAGVFRVSPAPRWMFSNEGRGGTRFGPEKGQSAAAKSCFGRTDRTQPGKPPGAQPDRSQPGKPPGAHIGQARAC